MTKEQQIKIEKAFKRFKKKYFKDRPDGFTGEELMKCKEAFIKSLTKDTK